MLNKNDPLIGVVQEVMKKNQAERDAAKLVNEKFGITDRKALPHERQGEWDAAYQTVLTEGINVPDVSYKKTEKNGNSDRRIITKDTKNVFSGGTTTMQTVDKNVNKSGSDSTTTKIKSQDLGKNKELGGKDYNISTSTVYKSNKVNEEELEEASLAGLAPPYKKTTKKDILVGRGVLKKHPTKPGKHVLAKKKQMEEAAGIQQPAPTATTNRPDRPSMGTQIGSTMRNSPVAGHAKQMMANQRPKPMMANQRVAGIQRPAPTATTNRPDRPSMGTQIGSTMRNSPVAGNARQMMANQRAKQMQEGDTTSPSAMGINKPDYAPAGTTPDYAKSKEQTVNRAAKSSLPAGTVAKSIK